VGRYQIMTKLLTEDEFNELINEYKTGKKPSHDEIEKMRDYYLNDPNTDRKIKESIIVLRDMESRRKKYDRMIAS